MNPFAIKKILDEFKGRVFDSGLINTATDNLNELFKKNKDNKNNDAKGSISGINSALKSAAGSAGQLNANIVDVLTNLVKLGKNFINLDPLGAIEELMRFTEPFIQMDAFIRENVNKSLGITGERADDLRKSMVELSSDLVQYGIELNDIVSTMTTLINETSRSVSLSETFLKDFIKTSRIAGLTAEESATFLSRIEGLGMSMLSGADVLKDMQNTAATMGLNSSKFIKTAAENLSLINTFGFDKGIRGFTEISAKASLIKFDLKSASSFAEGLFDVDKAIEAAAQLNILGGEFGNLTNATDLMFKATNDYAGLTEEIMNAQKQFVAFNEETGEFETDGLGLRRAREFAKVVGKSVDVVIDEAKRAARFDLISDKLTLFPGLDDEQKELIKNLGSINKDGEIEIGGKSLQSLIESGKISEELTKLNQEQIDDAKSQADLLRDQRSIAQSSNDYLRMLAMESALMNFGGEGNNLYEFLNKDLKDGLTNIMSKVDSEIIKEHFGDENLTIDKLLEYVMNPPVTKEAVIDDEISRLNKKMKSMVDFYSTPYDPNKHTKQASEVEGTHRVNQLKDAETNSQKFELGGTIIVEVNSSDGRQMSRQEHKVLSHLTNERKFTLNPTSIVGGLSPIPNR